jgi:hypothetical protein
VLLDYAPDVLSTAERPSNRCLSLIRTIPVLNKDKALSRPRIPNWVESSDDENELEEIAAIKAGFD